MQPSESSAAISYFTHECGASWSLPGDVSEAKCPNCDVLVLRRPRRDQPAAQGHFATLGDAFEAIRRALAWPPDAFYEAMFADARKGLTEVIDRFSECDRKRYEAEREVERLSRVSDTPTSVGGSGARSNESGPELDAAWDHGR